MHEDNTLVIVLNVPMKTLVFVRATVKFHWYLIWALIVNHCNLIIYDMSYSMRVKKSFRQSMEYSHSHPSLLHLQLSLATPERTFLLTKYAHKDNLYVLYSVTLITMHAWTYIRLYLNTTCNHAVTTDCRCEGVMLLIL